MKYQGIKPAKSNQFEWLKNKSWYEIDFRDDLNKKTHDIDRLHMMLNLVESKIYGPNQNICVCVFFWISDIISWIETNVYYESVYKSSQWKGAFESV